MILSREVTRYDLYFERFIIMESGEQTVGPGEQTVGPVIQVRNGGGSHKDSNDGGSERCLCSRCILNVEATDFPDG